MVRIKLIMKKGKMLKRWHEILVSLTTDQLDLIITERFYGYQDDEDITRELYNDINTFEQTGNEAVIVQKNTETESQVTPVGSQKNILTMLLKVLLLPTHRWNLAKW